MSECCFFSNVQRITCATFICELRQRRAESPWGAEPRVSLRLPWARRRLPLRGAHVLTGTLILITKSSLVVDIPLSYQREKRKSLISSVPPLPPSSTLRPLLSCRLPLPATRASTPCLSWHPFLPRHDPRQVLQHDPQHDLRHDLQHDLQHDPLQVPLAIRRHSLS